MGGWKTRQLVHWGMVDTKLQNRVVIHLYVHCCHPFTVHHDVGSKIEYLQIWCRSIGFPLFKWPCTVMQNSWTHPLTCLPTNEQQPPGRVLSPGYSHGCLQRRKSSAWLGDFRGLRPHDETNSSLSVDSDRPWMRILWNIYCQQLGTCLLFDGICK